MNLFCYVDNQFKDLCPPGEAEGQCANVEALAQEYREEKAAGKYNAPYIMSMPGGTTELSRLMDHTRKFDKDLHTYREAVRSGEQPDNTTVEGVESARKRAESFERAKAKLAEGSYDG